MNEEYIREIINKVKSDKMSEAEAFEALKELPYKDLGFANLDNHRHIRTGFPEVVYCEGKTSEQIRDIFAELSKHGTVMGTRADKSDFACVKELLPQACYHEMARIIEYKGQANCETVGRVAVVSAGTADMPVAEEAAVTAEILGNQVDRIYDVGVAGKSGAFRPPHAVPTRPSTDLNPPFRMKSREKSSRSSAADRNASADAR
ncbi:MAG: hypothetical protein MJ144_00850, partial [Clostridia bacterium]|nr:hypothetical protein [Clostridia bacterium]